MNDKPTETLTIYSFDFPKIGTCGEPIDKLWIDVSCTRAIPPIIIGFDGERNGYVIYKRATPDAEFEEVTFISEEKLEQE